MPIVNALKNSYDPHIKIADIPIADKIEWGDKKYSKDPKYIYVGIDPGIVNIGITILYCSCPITATPLVDLLGSCIVYLVSYAAVGCPWTASKTEKALSLKNIINTLIPPNATKITIEDQLVKTNNGFIEGIIYGCIKNIKVVARGRITSGAVVKLLSTPDLVFAYNKNNNKRRKQDCFVSILKILAKVSDIAYLNHRTGHYDTTDSMIIAICGTPSQ